MDFMADVKAILWLILLPQVSIYFKFSSEMLSRTSSQMCGRWYLPMFLLRDGLLALMYRASFIVLRRFWSSLPSMVKLSIVTSWPEMLWWSYMADGALRPCKKYGIDVHLKGDHTIKDHLMSPKDKDPILKKSGVIYRYKCDRVDCDDEYIGESARNFEERLKLSYMTIITSLVMMSLLTTLPYWEERTKTS